jgi:hypothetical protein
MIRLPNDNEIEEASAMNAGKANDPGAASPGARILSLAARRALAEAEARRAQHERARPLEVNGRGGLDPVRYGDWEVKGLAADF